MEDGKYSNIYLKMKNLLTHEDAKVRRIVSHSKTNESGSKETQSPLLSFQPTTFEDSLCFCMHFICGRRWVRARREGRIEGPCLLLLLLPIILQKEKKTFFVWTHSILTKSLRNKWTRNMCRMSRKFIQDSGALKNITLRKEKQWKSKEKWTLD